MEDWSEIRRLHRGEGMPIKAIARRLRISRNTVRSALAADEPPRYRRETRGSIVDEVEGQTEWGARAWTRPYHGILALIDESGEFYNQNAETGASPIATCPSPRALEFMLRQAGFRRTEIIEPPSGAYEQHSRGKRVVCAAYK